MNWKTIETVRIVNSEGNTENIEIQQSGNFYNIPARILKTVFVMKMTLKINSSGFLKVPKISMIKITV